MVVLLRTEDKREILFKVKASVRRNLGLESSLVLLLISGVDDKGRSLENNADLLPLTFRIRNSPDVKSRAEFSP